jgi:hypothetical protein
VRKSLRGTLDDGLGTETPELGSKLASKFRTEPSTWNVMQETFEPRGPRAHAARLAPSGCASAVRLAGEEEPECGVTEFAAERRYGKGGWVGWNF